MLTKLKNSNDDKTQKTKITLTITTVTFTNVTITTVTSFLVPSVLTQGGNKLLDGFIPWCYT